MARARGHPRFPPRRRGKVLTVSPPPRCSHSKLNAPWGKWAGLIGQDPWVCEGRGPAVGSRAMIRLLVVGFTVLLFPLQLQAEGLTFDTEVSRLSLSSKGTVDGLLDKSLKEEWVR